ncbi:MAG: NAD(P)-dependent oxidoreductase [Kiritimatiellae bacterium]|nr:NAD(P)-dependent oxidoreductase [Kiritimatiellia bacterium]MDD4736062.1 NAD(P)-dependent oxidoreductase [Kiritimatiellia bacterium]
MKKVLIPTKLNGIACELLVQHGGYEVIQDDQTALETLVASHPDAYALIVRSEKVTPELIDALPALKVIIRAGAGYNTIDTRYARKRGIDVMNTPGANANAVAEEVVALILADARHVLEADASVRAGKWEKKKFMGRELSHKTVGVVGLGSIGRLVVRRMSGFEVNVLGYDPMISEERAREMGVEMVDLPTLFGRSDYISLHIPENTETRGLVDASLLGLMKPGATLVNCARAGIVLEKDLRVVVADKGIRFLNDVYEKDAEGQKSVADIAHLMLPHLGASTLEANINAARRSAEELIEYDDKGVTSFVVNRDIPEGLDETYCELAHILARLCRRMLGPDLRLSRIETSFYGDLQPYARWLLVPMVAALGKDFDRSMDDRAGVAYLKEMGVSYENRTADEDKGFTNSITLDMTGHLDATNLRQVSIRGTVTEGNLMISRIDDYQKLYFEPRGHTAVFEYPDAPGILGKIGAAIASAGVNIDDVRNPHDSRGRFSIAILKVNRIVPAEVVRSIAEAIEARVAFCVEL